MSRSSVRVRLLAALVLAAALLAGLHIVMGARWFSFYGPASAAALLAPFVTHTLAGRLRTQGMPRWPAYVLGAVALLAALGQIGYWLAFFHGGGAVMLGIVRGMALESAGPYLPWLATAFAVALGWLLLRALGPDFRPR